MRKTPNLKAEKFRLRSHDLIGHQKFYASDRSYGNNGVFEVPYRDGRYSSTLKVMVSDGGGWDHVSVSGRNGRTPTWDEMSFIKNLFFKDDEVAMQLHVATKDHISYCDNCLHIWRPQSDEEAAEIQARLGVPNELKYAPVEGRGPIPLPPREFVGPVDD